MKQGKYDHKKIEEKWQKVWEKEGVYKTPSSLSQDKKYILDMFPYPSGATMHVGHLEGYVATDILSRYYRMKGYRVFHPMGWDAFGLPAENYAIKSGIHPAVSTHKNIEVFKDQLKISGLSYDWDYEIDTSSPEFYKWTQWLFILLFKKGLAYKKKAPVNWCPKDNTVLANEQVVNGNCERCGTPVVQKELNQWFFKITAYADRLISGLDKIDWLPEVKLQQKNWIGRSEGAEIGFKVQDADFEIKVFTTRPDTLFGATFMVVSPSYAKNNLLKFVDEERKSEVESYIRKSEQKSVNDLERDKTGVFLGLLAINPANDTPIPVFLADYVLDTYGTGAVMGVPAHDERDFEFAKEYNLKVIPVIDSNNDYSKSAYSREGKIINSGEWNGKKYPDDFKFILDYIKKKGWGEKKVSYHLRDWLISRQRYWGCPIPMIYCKKCGWQTVPESDLPVLLPEDVDFLPYGESPIARSKSFQKGVVCPICKAKAKREVDTMDTYVDSSWYFIRFVDPKNDKEFASQERIKMWLPVDEYVGGGHVVQHLLFSRFIWKVLYDEGFIDKSLGDEPFLKLRAPGWILGSDNRKMSKRWGNVVTPYDVIPKFGADTLRVYEMFMGPFDAVKPWSVSGVEGARRFLDKVWKVLTEKPKSSSEKDVMSKLHQTIKKVGKDLESYKFNTAISALMEFTNLIYEKGADIETLKKFCLLLAPFAPHLAEEVWQTRFAKSKGAFKSIHLESWPEYDPSLIVEDIVKIPVQVNGKLRSVLEIQAEDSKNENKLIELAKADEKVNKWLEGKKIKKTIFVPGKLLSFVV